MKHKLINDTLVVEANGVHAKCICGWDSGGRFSSMAASAAFEDHKEEKEYKNGNRN